MNTLIYQKNNSLLSSIEVSLSNSLSNILVSLKRGILETSSYITNIFYLSFSSVSFLILRLYRVFSLVIIGGFLFCCLTLFCFNGVLLHLFSKIYLKTSRKQDGVHEHTSAYHNKGGSVNKLKYTLGSLFSSLLSNSNAVYQNFVSYKLIIH